MIYRYENGGIGQGIYADVRSRGEAAHQQKPWLRGSEMREKKPDSFFPHSWGKYPPFGGGWGAIARPVLAPPCSPIPPTGYFTRKRGKKTGVVV